MSIGSLFQSSGAETAKALEPYDFRSRQRLGEIRKKICKSVFK